MATKQTGRGRTPRHGDSHAVARELDQLTRAVREQTRSSGKWLALIAEAIIATSPGDRREHIRVDPAAKGAD